VHRCKYYVISGAALALALAPLASAQLQQTPPLNTLRGVVIAKPDGKPLANVPVVMVHAEHGYLTIGSGGINGSGATAEQPDAGSYVARNKKVVCDAVSASDGSFVLRSFCAPQERWSLAAGDSERGFCLRASVVPAEFSDAPLRKSTRPALSRPNACPIRQPHPFAPASNSPSPT
jgi:hypothetical protein